MSGTHAAGPWHSRRHRLALGRPLADGSQELAWHGAALVGIVNVTPDSFSGGGHLAAGDTASGHERAVEHGLRLAREGALIVDVGGESTRPGAREVSADEELERVLPVIEALAREGLVLSVDTRKPTVARAALAAGARIVNDVGGLRDEEMTRVCVECGAPAIVMHMQGEPATMQQSPAYDDVVAEIGAFLTATAERAAAAGVPDVVIDPGIGFGKTVRHNLALLVATETFAATGRTVLIGASRKGFIDAVATVPRAVERLGGSIAVHLACARRGAALLRVHDVEQHRQALLLDAAMAEAEASGLPYSGSR